MTELLVSVGVLSVSVLLAEALRRAAARLPRGSPGTYLLEAACTFQVCCCSHELKLLGDARQLELPASLGLTFAVTLVHLLSFRGASCNPCGVLEGFCRGTRSPRAAALLIACQFAAALAARQFAASVWALGLSGLHVRHRRFGFRCFEPLGGTVLEAAAMELGCAFVMQAAAINELRAPCVAAVVTLLVYTGGGISGAFFNPVLAFSVQFPCSGHTYLEYCFVYWLGPVLGVSSCVLLVEKIVPFLSGTAQKPKTQ
ncbi:aquaporin-11 [Brachionichthys hirsutus]|uniref:aquaporin-11 n=1 Tax=Brachionichthys hirsutus TaxID=412623 RepID=UPI00360461F3